MITIFLVSCIKGKLQNSSKMAAPVTLVTQQSKQPVQVTLHSAVP